MKIERFELHSPHNEVVTRAYERAVSGRGQEMIEMDDFVELYGAEKVWRDKETVNNLKKASDENEAASPERHEAHRLATIFEAIVTEQIELSEWFGSDTLTQKTSPFDDYENKIDLVVENYSEQQRNHLAVAIDVTYSKHLNGKFDLIRKEIDNGTLSTVEYFQTSDKTFKGRLSNVPRVVLGTNKEKVTELAKLWVEGKKKELAAHPIQFQLLEEMRVQLHAFRDYAQSIGKVDIVRIYNRQLVILRGIIEDPLKQELRTTLAQRDLLEFNDSTHRAITQAAESFSFHRSRYQS